MGVSIKPGRKAGEINAAPRRPLTEMQEVVAQLLGQGHDYRAVAKRLGLAVSTVRVHAHAVAHLLPNPDSLRPARLVFLWAARRALSN